jgi:hypothetical protein
MTGSSLFAESLFQLRKFDIIEVSVSNSAHPFDWTGKSVARIQGEAAEPL